MSGKKGEEQGMVGERGKKKTRGCEGQGGKKRGGEGKIRGEGGEIGGVGERGKGGNQVVARKRFKRKKGKVKM